jgi:transketolase
MHLQQRNQSAARSASRTAIDPRAVRQVVLSQSKRANVGHIGSCLCIVEILCALYGEVLNIISVGHPDRDRVILSKGHAALALYAILVQKGWISCSDLDTFCGDDSLFGVHPESNVPGIDFTTGSLGHGLSIAAGAAWAARMQGSPRRVFCVVSDGEMNEGSLWEAVMFAAHHKLGCLTAILDWNGQQAFGRTSEVLDIPNVTQRWRSFGWRTTEVDGHSIPALTAAMECTPGDEPHLVLARTTFGKGVSYMEKGLPVTQTQLPVQPINWHYLPMSDPEYEIAFKELEEQR